MGLPFAIELGKDVIEEENGVFAGFLFDEFDFGEFESEQQCAKFAAGGGGADVFAVYKEKYVVSVRAGGGFGAKNVAFLAGGKLIGVKVRNDG